MSGLQPSDLRHLGHRLIRHRSHQPANTGTESECTCRSHGGSEELFKEAEHYLMPTSWPFWMIQSRESLIKPLNDLFWACTERRDMILIYFKQFLLIHSKSQVLCLYMKTRMCKHIWVSCINLVTPHGQQSDCWFNCVIKDGTADVSYWMCCCVDVPVNTPRSHLWTHSGLDDLGLHSHAGL